MTGGLDSDKPARYYGAMKKWLLLIPFLFLTACTKDSVLKNTALRQVITQFDDHLSALPDQVVARKVKSQTQIEVVDLKRLSDTEAVATVRVQSVSPENLTQSTSQDIQVPLIREDGAWKVKETKK